MNSQVILLIVACALMPALVPMPANAQTAAAGSAVYRCANNEYTNQIKGRTDCKKVEGGNITIVSGGTAPPQQSSKAVSKSDSPARVQSPEQRSRDADAKVILESELRKTEQRQSELEKDYNNGQPDKMGDEARNYQKYLDRVADLKAQIDRNLADIDGLKRELERFNH